MKKAIQERRTTPGLWAMKRKLMLLGSRALDRRFATGKALAAWRVDLVEDLGGELAISTQQRAIIDLIVKQKLLLDSIDAWILSQEKLVTHKAQRLIPVVRERQQLADALARYLSMLGLARRTKQQSLSEILAKPDDTPADGNGAAGSTVHVESGKD